MSFSRNPLVLVLPALLAAFPLPAEAQPAGPPAVAADVVVTAEATPAERKTLGVASTVVDRAEIERSKATSVLELLRSVPGLDVVQSGGPGAVGSIFLRGTNSNQTLVFVDGVRLNSPFFGGADLSALSTENVERIEVVRGPYSALYGSDAIGGVVQVFTRRDAPKGLALRGTFAAGSFATREGTLGASLGAGPLSITAGFRRLTTEGDLPNDFFAVTNASGSVEWNASPEVRVGLVLRRDDARTGIPFSGVTPTPRRTTTLEETSASVPVSIVLAGATTLEAALTYAKNRPGYSDPDDPFGFTGSKTDAERAGGRLTLSRTLGIQRLSVGADYDRTRVRNDDSFGLELDDRTTRTWSLFVEDRVALLHDRLVATLGIRRDDHSTFGASTSPRVALSYRPVDRLKLSAAAGSAFRSPTTGELYYPFSGNPNLQPERSASFEAGAEWDLAPRVVVGASVFENDIRDLIQYDFTTNADVNVGRARTRGVELALHGSIGDRFFGRASYTWLDAVDRETGSPLLRRPRHRASATVGASSWWGTSAELTGLFVGRRDDVDAATFQPVEDASYFRLDLAVTGPRLLDHVAPYVRITNLLGRDYVEVAGFPSPGRRVLVGIETGF